jgi:hypothetical protein
MSQVNAAFKWGTPRFHKYYALYYMYVPNDAWYRNQIKRLLECS